MAREFRRKELVLLCMPLLENGVGSAWGLPVIREGDRRVSALTASEKLERPGNDRDGPEARRLGELEELGVGPLGRYCGGEPIRPVRLYPADFFPPGAASASAVASAGTSAAFALACGFRARLEWDETRWTTAGDTPVLFHDHLEFLRTWGFSGGLIIEDRRDPAELLGSYLEFLRNEAPGAKILLVLPGDFFAPARERVFPRAVSFGDPGAGEIPLNFVNGGEPVLSASFCGPGLALYEDLPPDLRLLKSRCDILLNLVCAESPAGESPRNIRDLRNIDARLTLTVRVVRSGPKEKGKTGDPRKGPAAFLHRTLVPGKSGFPAALPALSAKSSASARPAKASGGNLRSGSPALRPGPSRRPFSGGREEAAALDEGLLPLREAGRIEAAGGGLFAVTAKFSGLRAADVKDEQASFYREGRGPWIPGEAPPVRSGATFTELNESQREFFLRWRHECRGGRYPDLIPNGAPGDVPLPGNGSPASDPPYGGAYIRLYARELAVCMGREGPLEHFLALRDLFLAYREGFPETGALLCRWLLDFAAIYGIASEALPLLIDSLGDEPRDAAGTDVSGTKASWADILRKTQGETAALLADLSVHRFFIEEDRPLEQLASDPLWVRVKALIPEKLLRRKEKDPDWAPEYRRALGAIDKLLRRDWNRGFFELFYPPRPEHTVFRAFEKIPRAGESSYRVYRPGFVSHRPLVAVLSELFLHPGSSPLEGVEARLRPLTLEGELLEELRRESDAVRDMLAASASAAPHHPGGDPPPAAAPAGRLSPGRSSLPPEAPPPGASYTAPNRADGSAPTQGASYTIPTRADLEEFIAALGTRERAVLLRVAGISPEPVQVTDMDVDAVNAAFNERFGDLLIETTAEGPSISREYRSILSSWE
ncbi:MAG: hypothetical protein LBK74_05955 [Treponema sp.]|jgi:hypothetical protein|nr:hypothetical protein [Treponema sp.]